MKKSILAAVLFVVIALLLSCAEKQNTSAQKQNTERSNELLRIRQDGLEGYMGRKGKIVIEPRFDWAGQFHEGLAPVQVHRKWGYIDRTGKYVIEPQFYSVTHFQGGIAAVQLQEPPENEYGYWGYISKTGSYILKPQYHQKAYPFSESLGLVFTPEGKYGYMDQTGKFVIPPVFDYGESFVNGLAIARFENKNGFINKKGEFVIVVNIKFEELRPFSNGLAPIRVDNKWGFIDETGKLAIDPQFDRPNTLSFPYFKEEVSAIQLGALWGYIDKKGTFLIPAQFSKARNFSDGIAAVRSGNNWGFIDKTGKYVVEPKFDEIDPLFYSAGTYERGYFNEGLMPVNVGGQWGYINKKGEFVIQPQWDNCSSHIDGIAIVYIRQKFGYIDTKGDYIWIEGQPSIKTGAGPAKSEYKLVGAWKLREQDSGTAAEVFFIIKRTQSGSLIKVSPTAGIERTSYVEERTEIRGDELIIVGHPDQSRIKIFKLTNTELVLETGGRKVYYKKTSEEELKKSIEEDRQRRKEVFEKKLRERMGY